MQLGRQAAGAALGSCNIVLVKKWAWPAVGLFVLACFWGFWSYGPFDLDEGLYSVALMEMQERGDWVVPTYRGEPFFEKPILFYWTAWIADLAGADGVVALRLPSILATISTLGLVGLFTKRIGPVMILSVSVLFMGVGRMFMPDPFLVLGMTLALLALWKTRDDPRWYVAAAIGLAISVLAKGPMPLVVLGLLGIYCHWRMAPWPKWPNTLRWRLAGLGILSVAVLPWYVMAAMRSPAFVDEFLIKQNLGRLAGADVVHAGPFWLYVPVVLVGLLPFSLSLVGAWRNREGGLEQYLWAFVWIVFVLFSLAGTKLPHYILPIFPALAVLIARNLQRVGHRRMIEFILAAFALTIVCFVAAMFWDKKSPTLAIPIYCTLAAAIGFVAGVLSWRSLSPIGQGLVTIAPLTLVLLWIAPGAYWNETHLDPDSAALAAEALRLPIIEYRTGGERESGKTSHPSMQWTIGKNTLAVENLKDLQRALAGEPAAVISRSNRLRKDVNRTALAYFHLRLLDQVGDWEVYLVSPIGD